LALHAVPEGIDPQKVNAYLESLPGVTAVHDLHIWGMSTTETALTAHLVKPGHDDDDDLIARASRDLHDQFGIEHTTLQWERNDKACPSGEPCEGQKPTSVLPA
ncbi:MAG: cation transporter, partial [Candidatus Riflebacteria bacterium]|nr:cation transporter [Candidatus Riflebacteria bacterium]